MKHNIVLHPLNYYYYYCLLYVIVTLTAEDFDTIRLSSLILSTQLHYINPEVRGEGGEGGKHIYMHINR